jgi:DNA repair protein RAD57
MTDLLHVIPTFPTASYTHLIPSLEKHLVTTNDLLTLDPVEIFRRARLPAVDVRRLISHVLEHLQCQLDIMNDAGIGVRPEGGLRRGGEELGRAWHTISLLDPHIDEMLGGGLPTGYITEVTGERCGFF